MARGTPWNQILKAVTDVQPFASSAVRLNGRTVDRQLAQFQPSTELGLRLRGLHLDRIGEFF